MAVVLGAVLVTPAAAAPPEVPIRLEEAVIEHLFRRAAAHPGYQLTLSLEDRRITDRHGLSLSQRLDRRFGKTTIAAKMTDVPGHSRAIVPLLAASGETWPMDSPAVPPEKRPSVTKAHFLPRCTDFRYEVG